MKRVLMLTCMVLPLWLSSCALHKPLTLGNRTPIRGHGKRALLSDLSLRTKGSTATIALPYAPQANMWTKSWCVLGNRRAFSPPIEHPTALLVFERKEI